MEQLETYLTQNGLKQSQFAELVSLHPSVVSRFIKGEARPSLETAFAIERATGGAVPASSWVNHGEASDA